ncbi:hypothetical protein MKX01_025215 [Papaver californicum]|nr:hypothetical protein MKX01_025215 [Papaver californicum]
MTESWESFDSGSQSEQSFHLERTHIEPIYDSFLCPLTKQVMRDPVSIENGRTFEREAIEKWFRELRESGRRLVCPLTQKELKSADLNPSIALRNTIEEWMARNESAQREVAHRCLSLDCSEHEILQALKYIQNICLQSRSNKHAVRNAELIPKVVDMLKSSSRRVRSTTLETLQIVAEEDEDNMEIIGEGDTVRTIVKFLNHEHSKEREEAVSVLYELSKSEALCEKIGMVPGAILILLGMSSSDSENVLAIERADKTLDNLGKCEKNVLQMAENGRLQPLLTLLLEGSPDTKLEMAEFLGDLVLSNDAKVFVAKTVGSALVNVMRSGNVKLREAALKALNQISSSSEISARVLIEEAGILPPLVKDLFTVGSNQLPMRLKEISATVLSNIVNSGYDFDSVPLGPDHHETLVSENIIHSLLHLISNTGPAIECKLLQILVGLTGSPTTVLDVVTAVKSSGAIVSLIQFIEAIQPDLRSASIKLLQNLSPHMGPELADALCGTAGQLGSLIKIISEAGGIMEEQAAAVSLTRQLLDEGAFEVIISSLARVRQGETRGSRFTTPYLEGLVRVLARLTFVLAGEPEAVSLVREYNIAALFADLLQVNGLDNVQMVAAMALENLSQESKSLTQTPEMPKPGSCFSVFCASKPKGITGLCRLHLGICSFRNTFCLLEGKAVGKLVTCLDHTNEKVVEAALAAICTLLDDDVDVEQGVMVLDEVDAIKLILDILVENRSEILRRRSVFAVERLLRTQDIAVEVSGHPNVNTALVDAFRHGDFRTRQIAERALKHVDKIPNFSGIFPK